MPPIIEGGRRRRTSRRPRSAAASFKSVALPLLLPLATMTTSMLLLLLLLPHLATVGVVVHAGPPPPDADCDDGNDGSATTATIKDSNRVFANINENYQSSSTSLDAVTRKIEDDYRKRQLRMRVYWKRIFEEIKVSNPVVFPPPDDDDDDDDGDGDEEHDDVDDDDDTAVYGEDLRRRRGRGSEDGEARVQQGPTASSSPLRRIPNLGEAAPADAYPVGGGSGRVDMGDLDELAELEQEAAQFQRLPADVNDESDIDDEYQIACELHGSDNFVA